MTAGYITREMEYKEVNATLRHYSNLRFLIIPLFFAINGGMFVGLQNDRLRHISGIYLVALLLPLVVASVFVVIERNLNSYIERFVSFAVELAPCGHWTARPRNRNRVTHWLIGLYLTVACCWVFFAVYLFVSSLRPPICL